MLYFFSLSDVFYLPKVYAALARLRRSRKWLKDPAEPYINVGTEDNPFFITTRSTSQLEGFHRFLRIALHNVYSSEIADHIIHELLIRWNLRKERNFGQKTGTHVYDLELLNEVKKYLPKPLEDFDEIIPTDDTTPVGVLYIDEKSAARQAWLKYVADHGPEAEVFHDGSYAAFALGLNKETVPITAMKPEVQRYARHLLYEQVRKLWQEDMETEATYPTETTIWTYIDNETIFARVNFPLIVRQWNDNYLLSLEDGEFVFDYMGKNTTVPTIHMTAIDVSDLETFASIYSQRVRTRLEKEKTRVGVSHIFGESESSAPGPTVTINQPDQSKKLTFAHRAV